jgi:hypothetical protein
MNKNILLVLSLVVFILAVGGYIYSTEPNADRTGSSEMERARIESQIAEKGNLIKVENIKFGEKISSPLRITGQARGNWYFEASFPIFLMDASNNVIVQSFATAKSEWMTTDFVPFEAEVEFTRPAGVNYGYLILKKDNPSGLPEYDDQLEIPIDFE